MVRSDRVNGRKFYAYSNGSFYVSTDGGHTFSTAATGLPTTDVAYKAVAGHEGDIWLTGSTGLYHSTNSGASFTKVSTVDAAKNIGYGKAAPGQTYPAMYLVGTVGGT